MSNKPMAQEKRRLDAAEEEEFEAYCLDLVLQPNTAYNRMLYWMITAFPGKHGYPIKMRPHTDWQGTANQVAKFKAKIPGIIRVWRPKKKSDTLLHMWFEDVKDMGCDEAYQVFHRTACQELGLTKSKERAVAALVSMGEGTERIGKVFDEEWGYKNMGFPELYQETQWKEARDQLFEKWKKRVFIVTGSY